MPHTQTHYNTELSTAHQILLSADSDYRNAEEEFLELCNSDGELDFNDLADLEAALIVSARGEDEAFNVYREVQG